MFKKIDSFFLKKNSINILYIPALLLFTMFVFYPLISGIMISFTNWNGYSLSRSNVGFLNYLEMFKDKYFLNSIKNTLLYGFGSTFFQQILGLTVALILNSKIKGRNVARTIIYLPVLVSPVIMGSMYYLLVQYNYGALNDIVSLFGVAKIAWLSTTNSAIAVIIIVNTLQFFGISMILYLAGLQGIPDMYYEAASIDGASSMDVFKNITMPLLYPAIVTSLTINLIGGLKLFDVIKVMTNGGPGYSTNSISTHIDLTYFRVQNAGFAAAMGVFLFIIILIVNLLLQKTLKAKEVDM